MTSLEELMNSHEVKDFWFGDLFGPKRKIGRCALDETSFLINDFIEECNRKYTNKRPFKSYYTRIWEEDGMIKFDVGSHTEFFFWGDKDK